MIEWSGGVMPGLRKCYSDITSSQLSREQILRYCEDLRPTKSLRRLPMLCRAVLQLTAFAVTAMSFAVQAQINTNPNDGPELGVR